MKIFHFTLIHYCIFLILSSITVNANNYNESFDSAYELGKNYKTTNEIQLYAPDDYTIDATGNVWLIYLANGKSIIQSYSKEGNYLYGIELPSSAKYALNIEDNYLIVACSSESMILKFTLDGTLINKYSYEEKISIYYWEPIKHIEPFGHFELKKLNGYVSIYLDSPNGHICYFNKKYTNGILHPFSVVLYFFVFLLLITFIEGIIYKIRTKGKIIDAFLFSNIRKAIVKINTKCKESMYPPKQH